MSTITAGTATTSNLTAVIMQSATHYAPADVAAIAEAIKNDLNVAYPTWPGAFSHNGLLYIPNRGMLKVLPGDLVAVDLNGWPILVSAQSLATGGRWVHS